MWQAKIVDDLTKVYPDVEPTSPEPCLHGFRNERVCFQVALLPPSTWRAAPDAMPRISVSAPGGRVRLWNVGLVPVALPCFAEHDAGYDRTVPGLYPDLLAPNDGHVRFTHLGWHAVWVDVEASASTTVTVRIDEPGRPSWHHELRLEVIEADAPPAPVVNLQWVHADCLADYYKTPAWSPDHWVSVESTMAAAADMGVTGVLTPIWTPPLDTAVGSYRTPVQLLDVHRDPCGRYSFGTQRLDTWLAAMKRAGLTDVECPPLFTQWGAASAPQIWIDGERAFGWDTPALDPVYRGFLADALPMLRSHLERAVGARHVWWHVSDEPPEHALDPYASARGAVKGLLRGAQIIDAVSEPAFASLVDTPVVATDAVRLFRAEGHAADWVYHCVAQPRDVANRFIAQPAIRHRVIAEQLYLAGATGFLHWGFNFYSTAGSRSTVDPYRDTSAGGSFPGGDAFVVYPGADGTPLPSLRHRILSAAWSDLRAFYWAEQLVGRDRVVAILDPGGTRDYASGWGTPAEYHQRRSAVRALISVADAELDG